MSPDLTHRNPADRRDCSRRRGHRHAIRTQLAGADGLLLLTDFDGTLVDIADRPEGVSLAERTRDRLATVAAGSRTAVGVVTGRALADVRERIGVSGVYYAGNHGLELHREGETTVHPEARAARASVQSVCDGVGDRIAGVDGAFVENKGVTASIHHRLADEGAVPRVRRAVRDAVAAHDDVRLTVGKAVLEVRPAAEWGKGRAVEWLAERIVPDDERWLPVYLGDDRTDEDAFRTLGADGVAIKIGGGPSVAGHRMTGPAAVTDLLEWLARADLGGSGPDEL